MTAIPDVNRSAGSSRQSDVGTRAVRRVVIGATLVLVLLVTACAGADPTDRGDTIGKGDDPTGELSLMVDGVERWFTVVRPPDVGPGAPLVLLMHGGGRSMRHALDREGTRDWVDLADEAGFVLIAPNGVDPRTGSTSGGHQQWNDLREPFGRADSDADDVAFVGRLVEWTVEHHQVDRERVFVTGSSNGGMMAQRLLIESPDTFAAGASFIANLPAHQVLERPRSAVPLLLANGTDDPLMPWSGGDVGKGRRGAVISVAETRAWWAESDSAEPTGAGATRLDDTAPNDGCTLEMERLAAGPDGADLVVLTMQGGGHAMPSTHYGRLTVLLAERVVGPLCRDADGARIAWDFFATSAG